MAIEVRCNIDPRVEGLKCQCGGYAVRVEITPEEEREYGCGRPNCCSRAFVCGICGDRIIGNAMSPEME